MVPPDAPSPPPLRLGFVGAGEWCRSAHLPSLAGHPGCVLVALASRTRETAERAAREHGFGRVEDDWRAVAEAEDVDAVFVTAPAPLHAPIAHTALASGKHVFCEAPLAMDAREAGALCRRAEASGRTHGYSLPRPFLYGGERVRELLADGAVGEARSATLVFRGNPWLLADPRAVWRARADAVPALLVGVCAGVLGELFGDVVRVSARLERIAPAGGDGSVAAAPDYFSAQWTFASGLRATLDAGTSPAPPPGNGLTVFGASGCLVWDWTTPGRVLLAGAGERAFAEVGSAPPGDLGRAFPFARAFVDAARAGHPVRPDFRSGWRELRLIEACVGSAERGQWVEVEDT